MARGFESKSVADQQESAQERRRPRGKPQAAAESVKLARRRQLQLAQADIERRLRVAVAPAHRQMLERALNALESEIATLD